MHAFILINANPLEFAKKENAKVLNFALQKIEDGRDLKKLVKFSYSEKTAILIENIDNATPETLNAFLKNLEEPNKNLIYILTATNLNNVLPTIISRCEIVRTIKTNGQKLITNNKTSKDFLEIKDRDEAIKYIENAIFFAKSQNNYKNMENYLYTLKNLKANGNVSLQMTNLLVTMGSHG